MITLEDAMKIISAAQKKAAAVGSSISCLRNELAGRKVDRGPSSVQG
jgi:hypothetical protein